MLNHETPVLLVHLGIVVGNFGSCLGENILAESKPYGEDETLWLSTQTTTYRNFWFQNTLR